MGLPLKFERCERVIALMVFFFPLACIQSVLNDGKFVVKFDDDDLERSLRREDLIRVDALVAGLPVGVMPPRFKSQEPIS